MLRIYEYWGKNSYFSVISHCPVVLSTCIHKHYIHTERETNGGIVILTKKLKFAPVMTLLSHSSMV